MKQRMGLFGRLRQGLAKSRGGLLQNVKRIFNRSVIDDDVFEDLEEVLIGADVGVDTTLEIVEELRTAARERKIQDPAELFGVLKERLAAVLQEGDHAYSVERSDGPHVTLIAGVNGSGKTTTIGKLAARLRDEGKSVVIAAADTFRAAAVDQLTVWSERVGVPIVKHQEGADPAAVAFDAADSAISRGADSLIVDTAGRLHTKVNLMEELKKIQRVIGKRISDAPHEVLLVLDATTGQNGLEQARRFTEALHVTGIVLTKLDGTAKGGIAVAIQRQLGIPIKFIGVGEAVDDLQPFDAGAFVEALLGESAEAAETA